MVFGGSDFDSLQHIILVVFMFGGSNQTFGRANAIVLAQSTFSGFSPYGIMVLVLDHAIVLVLITVLILVTNIDEHQKTPEKL